MNLDEVAFALFFEQCDDWDVNEWDAREEWDADPELRQFWRRQVTVVVQKIWSPFSVEWVSDYDIRVTCNLTHCGYTELLSLGSDNAVVWADHGKRDHNWMFGDARE